LIIDYLDYNYSLDIHWSVSGFKTVDCSSC